MGTASHAGKTSTKGLGREELVYPGTEGGPGSTVQMQPAVIPVLFQGAGSLEPGEYLSRLLMATAGLLATVSAGLSMERGGLDTGNKVVKGRAPSQTVLVKCWVIT